MSAESPFRGFPSFIIRVYPPGRSLLFIWKEGKFQEGKKGNRVSFCISCMNAFVLNDGKLYLYLGPKIRNNFSIIAFSLTTPPARRLWCKEPTFAWVTIFSATRLSSFALAVVVIILSCLMRDVTIFRSMAHRWSESFPSLRKLILLRMAILFLLTVLLLITKFNRMSW